MMRLFYCGNSRVMTCQPTDPRERRRNSRCVTEWIGTPPSLCYCPIALLCCDHSSCRITIFLLIIFIPFLLSVLKNPDKQKLTNEMAMRAASNCRPITIGWVTWIRRMFLSLFCKNAKWVWVLVKAKLASSASIHVTKSALLSYSALQDMHRMLSH